MLYRAEDTHRAPAPQKSKQSHWLEALIMWGFLLIGLQVVSAVLFRNVLNCVVRYSHSGGACSQLFTHYAYQTPPGLAMMTADVVAAGACLISLVMYLHSRGARR